ncbi:hypothetical protein FQZ97_807670 [compost metagenome]
MALARVHDGQAGGARGGQQALHLRHHGLHGRDVDAGLVRVATGAAEVALHVDDDQRGGGGFEGGQGVHGAGRVKPVVMASAMRRATSSASSWPLAASEPLADESTPEGGTQSVRLGYMS